MRVLFVCTGNSCRSAMAELYFNDLCRKAGRDDITGDSAGTCAWDGAKISTPAASVLWKLGIPSEDFRSSALTPALADEADLIVPMTRFHCDETYSIAPECKGKIRLLLGFGGKEEDVPDPYGGSVEYYEEIFEKMRPSLDFLAQSLFK